MESHTRVRLPVGVFIIGTGTIVYFIYPSTGGQMKAISDYLINVPSADTPRIQESHITIGHIICQLVEEKYFAPL